MIKLLLGNKQYLWLLLLVLLLPACTKTKTPEQLVFADPDNPIASLFYIAEAKGYFKEENLTISYKKYSSGRDSIESVLRGESDIAVATEFPYAKVIFQGKPIRLLCAVQRTNYSSAVVARRDRGINVAQDLRGKRIGLALNTNSDYLLSAIVREAGLDDDAVIRVPLEPLQLADALENGQVDAIAAWQPHVANAKARFSKDAAIVLRTLSYSEFSIVGALPQSLVEKREAVQRLINVLVRTEDFIAAHSAEALQIVLDHQAGNGDESLREDWSRRIFQVRLDNLLLTALENEGTWLVNRGKFADGTKSSLVVPEFLVSFAPEFLELVRPQSVTTGNSKPR